LNGGHMEGGRMFTPKVTLQEKGKKGHETGSGGPESKKAYHSSKQANWSMHLQGKS